MGVYIKGMEMPVDCHDCELPYVLPNCPCYEKTFVEYWNDKSISLCRHPRCPLVPVPPHGQDCRTCVQDCQFIGCDMQNVVCSGYIPADYGE